MVPAVGANVDPVIEHLLQNARSDAVRAEFLKQPAEDYTVKHTLKFWVEDSLQQFERAHSQTSRKC